MDHVFDIVYAALAWFSNLTGLTYEEVNIIAYYVIIPFIYFHLIDRIFKTHYRKIGFLVFVLLTISIVDDFEVFSKKLFQLSVDFLLWFDIIGLNYIQASVIICVLIPLIILLALFYIIRRQKHKSPAAS